MPDRPPHLPPGTPLGAHYTIEGLVRLAEGRMFYLANDTRTDLEHRRCWMCGYGETPRTAPDCQSCETPFQDRRFLISARWQTDLYAANVAFFQQQLAHPGLCAAIDVFEVEGVMYSVVPYLGEGLMVDEAAPLTNQRVLNIAQRLLGTLAYLQTKGIQVGPVRQANILISPDSTVRLFDLDVVSVAPDGEAVPPSHRADAVRSIGELLRRYVDVRADDLLAWLYDSVENADSFDLLALGREVERRFDHWSGIIYPPLIGGMTDVGLTRQLNEDNWGWKRLSDRTALFVVADGMGGHDCGEVASDMAVKVICDVARDLEQARPEGDDALESMLDQSFQTANNSIKENAESRGTDMGTTMVSLMMVDEKVGFLANVGDSRGYLLREGSLHQVTKDHSLVQKMVERGRITAEEARHHPHSNILLRTVGTERDIDIDIFRVEFEPGDKVVMCSDGLWGEVEDRDIESILNTYADPRIAARELVRAAHHGGGKDNVTLMIVTVPA